MLLVAYRNALRASELIDMRWDQIDFATSVLHVRRNKPATHPIPGDELRALRKLQREQEPKSPFVFVSERGSPFAVGGFARMIERAGTAAPSSPRPSPRSADHRNRSATISTPFSTTSVISDVSGPIWQCQLYPK